MSFGKLNDAQCAALKPLLKGKHITDLGFGDGELTHKLIDLGARHVTAVDKEMRFDWPFYTTRITYLFIYFRDVVRTPQRAFLSWPSNWIDPSLLELVQKIPFVSYLGKNVNGTCCGWPQLYEHFQTREILAHVPDKRNTLTCYGPRKVRRSPTGEELAGSTSFSAYYNYEQAERAARRRKPGAKPRRKKMIPEYSLPNCERCPEKRK